MPITQSRMLSLLSASRTIVDKLAAAQAEINLIAAAIEGPDGKLGQARVRAMQGDMHDALSLAYEAFNDLKQTIVDQTFSWRTIQTDAIITFTREETHFNIRKRSNDSKRKWQKGKRDGTNISPPEPQEPYNAAGDGIPDLKENYTREDYEREKQARQMQTTTTMVKSNV
jgi:hypothetical protein